MMLSVMVMSTGATSFSDEDEFSPQYKEAAEVLTGMGVIQGYEDGSYFLPQRNITRAQVATMIYRAVTHDVNDTQTGIYKDYNKFKDVPSTDWSAGYVNYCANGEIIKGFTPDTFGPLKNVTGYQVLAMILRAVGYDANDEFTGDGWAIRVATTAQQLGILENVQEATLGEPATRELVAELIFQTMTKVDMVDYTPAFGYQPTWPRETLGEDEFGLTKGDRGTIDDWGRPGYVWSYDTGDKSTTIEEAALATYKTAVTECDVADDTTDKDATYDLYVNSKTNNAGDYTINATDTTTKIGAQGRLTEVYTDRIVMIDTFLAQVDSVKDATFDAAGHMKTPATITLSVYDQGYDKGASTVVLTNGETNYTYTEDQMVLLNAYTEKGTYNDSGAVLVGKDKTATYGEIYSAATAITGTQTIIYNNANQHNINGTVYDDAMKLYLDQAKQETTNHTWFFDQYNNLIGVTDISADTNYGIINRIWWAGNAADGSGTAQANVTYMDGTTGTVTISDMTFMGGNDSVIGTAYSANMKNGTPTYSTDVDDLMRIMPKTGSNTAVVDDGYFYVSPYYATNEQADDHNGNGIVDDHLFQFTIQADGTVAAKEVAGAANDTDGLANVNTTVSKDSITGITANSSTVFLIRNADDTYTSITGINNIGSYQLGEVDYVDMNRDGVAEYVYVTALPVNSKMDVLFYYADGQGSYETTTGIYTIPGYIDGVAGNLVTKNSTIYNDIVNGADYSLYKVTTENGMATSATVYSTPSTGTAVGTMTNNSNYTDYAGNLYVTTITGAANDKYSDNLYTDDNGYSYLTNGNTKLYGEWATDMSDKNVILVWTGGNTNGMILQAYVVDQNSTVPDPTPVTTGNIVRVVQVYQGGNLISTLSYTQTGITAGTYTTGQDYATVSKTLPTLAVTGATVVKDVTEVTVEAGTTVTVVYTIAVQ